MRELLGRLIFPVLPEFVLRLLGRWEKSDSPVPPMPSVPAHVKHRLLIGPQSEVGQATEWARAVERAIDNVIAVSMTKGGSDSFEFPVDYTVPNDVYYWSRRWQRRFRRFALRTFSHAIIESGFRLFGNGVSGGVAEEIRQLRSKSIRVAFLFHGSDIRNPALHREETEWSPYYNDDWVASSQMGVAAEINQALVRAHSDIPVFVATPDLLSHVPKSTWLPLVVEQAFLKTATQPPMTARARKPRVVHAPSSSFVKGSDLVEPVLHRLSAEGLIDYQRIQGALHRDMPGLYAEADIVLDQFRIGSYGLAAVEAMAMGRIVVGHVTAEARAQVLRQTGSELPVVEATAHTLEAVLRDLCRSTERGVTIGASSRQFVVAVHDGDLSAQRLRAFLEA